MPAYDAVAQNESAVTETGPTILADIARDLVRTLRRDVTADWVSRDDVRAKIRSTIKRLLAKYGYPPDGRDDATNLVLRQMETFADAKRRIELLGIDREGRLVVFELKRTPDGGRLELQALRYAAMISTMTFDDLVGRYAHYLATLEPEAADLTFITVTGFRGPRTVDLQVRACAA